MAVKDRFKWAGFVVRRRGPSWQLDLGMAGGKRVFLSAPTVEAAKLLAQQKRAEREQHGINVSAIPEKLRRDAVEGAAIMQGRSTLTEAARFWKQHHPATDTAISLRALVDEYLQDMARRKLRPRSIKDARSRLNRLCATLGDEPASSITRQGLEAALDGIGADGQNRLNFKRVAQTLFSYAIEKEVRPDNPALKLAIPTIENDIPAVLTADQAHKIMLAAVEVYPALIPYAAIGLFAGVRPAELLGLTWQDIDLDGRKITIVSAVAKTRRSRIITLEPNLIKWLASCRKAEGRVAPPEITVRRWMQKIRAKAGITRWTPDVMRHSYGSYHLALTGSIERTALQMGHTETDTLFRHYRGLVTKEQAEQYFAITPPVESNLIQLGAAS